MVESEVKLEAGRLKAVGIDISEFGLGVRRLRDTRI